MATITTVKERINQLSQASFQILCDALLAREGYPGIVALGTQDGAEKTTPGTPDTYFCLSGGKYVFAEYTTQKSGLSAKIRSDIEKCLDEESTKISLGDIAEIVYCHTSSNINPSDDHSLKLFCELKGIKLTLIGIDLLAEKLMNYPIIIRDHLGLSIDSEQIQNADDFVKQYNSNALSATLDTTFLFRDKEIEEIEKAFGKVSTVLLTGPAGTGKTRLALEFAKNHASTNNERLLCIHDRSLPMYADLKLYLEKPGAYFLFVDDANQLSALEHIIEYANKEDSGYQVHILMTVRDYALAKVKTDINGIIHYEVVNISPFSDEEINSLMKSHFDIQNPHYLDRIVQISEGNARIAMLAGKIACDANRLDAINDVSSLYADYFGKALHESGIDTNSNLLVAAGIMAFLNAIHLDHIDAIMPILEEKGLTKASFEENLRILHEHEIVDICNDKGVRFSEQCMENFVLKYVFFDKKVINLAAMIGLCYPPYPSRTVQAVNTLCGVFRNAELHGFVEREILSLWKKLEDENSPYFMGFLKSFFLVNEIPALLIVKNLIEKTTPAIMKSEDIHADDKKNYNYFDDDIITILGGFCHSKNLDAALDLFFQYYLKRPDLYMQFYHSSISRFSIDKYSARHRYETQIKFFTKMLESSQGENVQLISLFFFDVAEHFLKLEFSPYEDARNGKGVTLYRIPITHSEGVEEYRKIIWENLINLSSMQCHHERIKGILHSYGHTIHSCSKDVINGDIAYICNIAKMVLSPECLEDCLIADALQKVFSVAEHQTNEFCQFFSSPKYKLYQLLKGPKWESNTSYREREQQKEDSIREYLLSTGDKTIVFNEILEVILESSTKKVRESYEIAKGLNTAIQALSDNKDDYIPCVNMILLSNSMVEVDYLKIVEKLFLMLSPKETFALLNQCHSLQRNNWLFAYYHELPQEMISQEELDGLYSFLLDDSDRNIQSSPYRDIIFLNKYLSVDSDVILTASRIILNKKEYSPFIVAMYFGFQFNEQNNSPHDVIQKYRGDIGLLEQIYLCVVENDHFAIYDRSFLPTLFKADKTFVKTCANWFVEKAMNTTSDDKYDSIISAFYNEEDYSDILDYVIDVAFASSPFPELTSPKIFMRLLALSEDRGLHEKRNFWINHFIICYCKDKHKMEALFEALIDETIDQADNYYALLVNHNADYDMFEAIPLTPPSYSWSGSLVPLYSSWVEKLEKLLPLFSGLKFIDHKNRVLQLIEYWREKIKEEEISDILGK